MYQSSAYYQLGPLREYFEDPNVFEIRINRYNEVVCDTFAGRKIIQDNRITDTFIDHLTAALTSANDVKRQMINDVVLPDGSRGIICLPPAVIPDTAAIAFRKNIALDKNLATLSREGIFEFCQEIDNHKRELGDDDILLRELYCAKRREEFLLTAVQKKRTVVVVGETGSGKTVLTRALLKAISPHERVIIMEDAHEVEATHLEEVVYMRYGGKDKPGLATPTQCLKACMRLTPDRIFMTELRDDAAWDYLQALNTGHPGGLTSTHANSAMDAFTRIGLMVKATEVGRMLDISDIMRLLHSTIDVVVFMAKRKIREIYYSPEYKYECMNGGIK